MKNKSTVIIIALLVIILGMATTGVVLLGQVHKSATTNISNVSSEKVQKESKEEEKVLSLGEFMANTSDNYFLKINVSIGYTDKKAEEVLTAKTSPMRDTLNKFILKSKHTDFNGDSIETTTKKIIEELNTVVEHEYVTSLYFDDIMKQSLTR